MAQVQNVPTGTLDFVPTSKKAFMQLLCSESPESLNGKSPSAKSPDTKALDVKSQSRKCPQNGESETPTNNVPFLQKLSRNRKSNSSLNTSTSETNTDNEDNARQIDSNRKVKPQDNSENCYGNMEFSVRDLDDRDDTKATATVPDNLDMSIREREGDVEDKLGSHNQRKEVPGKQYFLNVTYMEEEKFLPMNNIVERNNSVENMSDFIEMLRNRPTPKHIATYKYH